LPTILTGDTNIWANLHKWGLPKEACSLPVTFAVPDLLFECELANFEGPDLVRLDLVGKRLAEAGGKNLG